jgi:hypothetical protein
MSYGNTTQHCTYDAKVSSGAPEQFLVDLTSLNFDPYVAQGHVGTEVANVPGNGPVHDSPGRITIFFGALPCPRPCHLGTPRHGDGKGRGCPVFAQGEKGLKGEKLSAPHGVV